MGIWISSLFNTLFGSKEVRILILGLDNAGRIRYLSKYRENYYTVSLAR